MHLFQTPLAAFRSLFRSRVACAILLSVLFSPPLAGAALSITLADEGAAVDLGTGGPLTLYYPTLTDSKGAVVHKIESKNVNGKTAMISYEGGVKLEMTVADMGEVSLHFSNLPADVTQWKMDSILPLALVQGGKWKVGTVTQPFPAKVSAKPHLFQDHAAGCEVTTAKGAKITWTLPQYTFLEVVDNRVWQWEAFNVSLHVPCDGDNKDFKVSLAVDEK